VVFVRHKKEKKLWRMQNLAPQKYFCGVGAPQKVIPTIVIAYTFFYLNLLKVFFHSF